MGDNLVSFDEEKLMNEILDQGIDELRKSNTNYLRLNIINNMQVNRPSENLSKNELLCNKTSPKMSNKSICSDRLEFNKNIILSSGNEYFND